MLQILTFALVAALVSGYIETAMVALLPQHLINFHYAETQALLLLSVFGLGGTLLQTPLGWVADRWGFRTGQVLCLCILEVGCILLVTMVASPCIVVAILFAWGGCAAGLNTLAVIEAGSTLTGGLSAIGMALIASSYTLGGVVGPILTGTTMTWAGGHGAMLTIVAVISVHGAILAISRRTKILSTG